MKIRIREHIVPNQEPVYFVEYFATGLFFGGEWENLRYHEKGQIFFDSSYRFQDKAESDLNRFKNSIEKDKELERMKKQREKDTKNNIIKEIEV